MTTRRSRLDIDRLVADYIRWRDADDGTSVETVTHKHGVTKPTLYTHLRRRGVMLRTTIGRLPDEPGAVPSQLVEVLDEIAQSRTAMARQLRELERRVNFIYWALVVKGVATERELTPPPIDP